jgi:MFS family permease
MSRLTSVVRARPPAGTTPLVIGTGVLAIGKGVFLSTLVIYLLQIVHLGTGAASACASAWGLAAVLASVPAGLAADRRSPRLVGIVASLGAVPLLASVGDARGLEYLVPAIFGAGVFDAVGAVARRALLAARKESGVAALSWARTASNVGFAIGAVLSVPLLGSHSAQLYRIAYLLAAASYAAIAGALALTADTRPASAGSVADTSVADAASTADAQSGQPERPERAESRRIGVAAALAGSTAALSLHTSLLDVAFPIWIVKHTSVPVSAFGWLLLLNTVFTVVGQIPVSRRSETVEGALRSTTRSALWTTACCALLVAAGAGGSTAWQVVALSAAMLALTLGELLQSAGEWGLSALLARDHERGLYQGACVFGESVQSSGGPLLVGTLIGAAPLVGWGVLGVLLLSGYEITRRLPRNLRQELVTTQLVGCSSDCRWREDPGKSPAGVLGRSAAVSRRRARRWCSRISGPVPSCPSCSCNPGSIWSR